MDELQLNFSTEPTNKQILNHSQVTNNLKRGSWLRRRVVAKKIVHRENKKLTTKSLDVPLDIELEPLTKNTNEQHVMKKKSNGTFVTSLFTSNPELPNLSRNIPAKTVTSLPVFSATTFAGTGLHSLLTDHLKLKLSVDTPTPIQRATIPHLIQCDQDAIIQAQTGSGKTYAFLLPILHRLISSAAQAPPKHQDFFSRSSGTFAIVLVPTRELAQQISTVLEKILSYSSGTSEKETRLRHWIVSGIVTGGEKRKSEKSRLRKGNSILVCTPGRLLDHLKTTDSFIVGNVRWLVLDEADNLLSLGFEQTLKEILQILDDKRKNVF
jgi:ATP-dependent RNA helicase DDX31/DBP7